MRLIDADKLEELYQVDDPVVNEVGHVPLPVIRQNIADMPTIDAVPVVRCKDCDKSERSYVFGSGWRFCENNQQHHKDDHFCGYGERKEGEG